MKEQKERNTVKIDAKITETLYGKIVKQAEKEKRNKSQMVRVLLEDGIAGKILDDAVGKEKGDCTPTYYEWLASLTPPFKCGYDGNECIAIDKENGYWKLRPCYKSYNHGSEFKIKIGSLLTHVEFFVADGMDDDKPLEDTK